MANVNKGNKALNEEVSANSLDAIKESEFSKEFTEHMMNAMCMSYYKYGRINNYISNKSLDYITKEVDAFKEDGNAEHMVNIADYAMIRYMLLQGNESYKAADSHTSTHNIKYQSVADWL